MEAVQEGLDTLSSLEERITRAVQAISHLRGENAQLNERARTAEDSLQSTRAELDDVQALSNEFQKENGELTQRVNQLSQELETMKGERKQVKSRIEKLLTQLDLLSAS